MLKIINCLDSSYFAIFLISILFCIFALVINQENFTYWKNSDSERKYFDFNIKTKSTIMSHNKNLLNYTVQIINNDTSTSKIKLYSILESNNGIKQISDKQPTVSIGNITKQFEIFLEKGKNKWSLVMELSDINYPKIIHHGEFDEIEYD